MTRWVEIEQARARAHAKHGDNSIERVPAGDPRWMPILIEEVGEVAHALTYDSGATMDDLRGELVDVLSVASAWLDAIDNADTPGAATSPLRYPTSARIAVRLESAYAERFGGVR